MKHKPENLDGGCTEEDIRFLVYQDGKNEGATERISVVINLTKKHLTRKNMIYS